MKKILLILCALLLTAVGAWADDYTKGDVAVTNDGFKCTIKGENLVKNGSFEEETMTDWAGISYGNTTAVTSSTRYESGGYDGGAYVQFSSAGAGAESTPHQAIAVTEGTTYLFIAYTSGTTPDAGNLRYSALFEVEEGNDGTLSEVSHTVGSTSYGNNIVTLEWGADAGETSSTWTKTTGIFTATTSYVGIRMGWSTGSYDGFQLYEVEDVECHVNGLEYKVNSANMVSNHSFECDYENWTSSNDYSTQITSSNFSVKNDGAQNGALYLVGTGNTGSSGAGSLGTAWDIEAGKTYYFSYWIKQYTGFTSTTTGFYIMTSVTNTKGTDYNTDDTPYHDKDGAHLLHNFNDGADAIGTSWQKVEVVYTNGTGDDAYSYLQVNFRWLNNQFAFDNFQLYEVEASDEEIADDCDYKEGDEIEMSNFKGTVVGTNLFVNGGFNNGVEGWTAGNGYTEPLNGSNIMFTETGGYNDGQYVTIEASGAADSKTPTQAISVTQGKSYLLVGYTKFSGSDSDLPNSRYSALFAMESATHEASHYENGTSYSNDLVELQFENTGAWVKTEGIFTVPAADADSTYNYVGMRMNWSTASYDGLQLYELDGEFTFPEDTDYAIDEVVTVDGTVYTVKGANLVENGSFNERTTGWTYGRAHTNSLGASQVTYNTDGGYNDGPYITSKGGGSDADTTPSKEVDVETGKTYLFVGYTNGSAPSDDNKAFNGLFEMSYENESFTEGDVLIQMSWDDPDEELNGWTKTEGVFTAEDDYVSIRFAWCPGASFDGIQIYEVEATGVEWEMTDAGWGTMILPFAVETVPNGLTMYAGDKLTLEDDALTVDEADAATSIAANTPYLVSGTAGTYTFTGTAVEATTLTAGYLTGTYDTMDCDALLEAAGSNTVYLLQNQGDGAVFYQVVAPTEDEDNSKDATLTPYHCYLTIEGEDGEASPTKLSIVLPGTGEETGIVAVESETLANDAIYDLSGRRVAKAVKGVYIQNGKKVLVK